MFGPHPVAVNAKSVAGAGSDAGFFFRSHPLKRKNCVVDLVQLLLKMGNQCREVDLVQQGVTPGKAHNHRHPRFCHGYPGNLRLHLAIESAESGYGRTRDPHGAIP